MLQLSLVVWLMLLLPSLHNGNNISEQNCEVVFDDDAFLGGGGKRYTGQGKLTLGASSPNLKIILIILNHYSQLTILFCQIKQITKYINKYGKFFMNLYEFIS